jgi:hypothetical protein
VSRAPRAGRRDSLLKKTAGFLKQYLHGIPLRFHFPSNLTPGLKSGKKMAKLWPHTASRLHGIDTGEF